MCPWLVANGFRYIPFKQGQTAFILFFPSVQSFFTICYSLSVIRTNFIARSFFGCFFATTISLGPSRTEPFFLQRSRFFAKQSKKRTSESRERKKEKNPSLQSNYSLAQYEEYQASMIASKERQKYYKW